MPFSSQAGDDFVSQQYNLNFPPGQTRVELMINITDDNVIEAMESFQLLLSIPDDLISKGAQVGPNAAATVTIMDNDGELLELCTCWLHTHTYTYSCPIAVLPVTVELCCLKCAYTYLIPVVCLYVCIQY